MTIAGDVKVARMRKPIAALKLLAFSPVSMGIAYLLWKLGGGMARVESDSLVSGVKHLPGLTTLAFYAVSVLMGGLGALCFFGSFWLVIVGARGASCPGCRAELDVREMPATVRCAACENEYRVISDGA